MRERLDHEPEPVWSVDADVGGDGTVALPRPGGIAFPSRAPRERPLTAEEIERRRLRRERWGPPRPDLDRRTLIITLAALAGTLAVAIFLFGLSLSTDRYLLVLLIPALIIRRGRLYLKDFGIFAALVVLYSELRGVAHLIRPDPFYTPQLNLDRWMFAGHVPTVELQNWFWTGSMQWYDHLLVDVSKLHFIVPPLLAFLLWMKRRALFFRYASSMLLLSFTAALTFLLFPAAPPWAAGKTLLTPTVTQIDDHNWAAVGSTFSLSKLIAPNPYAAIPSLHGGYAMLCFLFVALLAWRTRWRWLVVVPAAFYPLILSFVRVYTGDHYVIDLLLGYAYAVAAFLAVGWYWRRNDLPG
jgi:membrane-associated phospholipid phosphatase